jgi:hypothetical protein
MITLGVAVLAGGFYWQGYYGLALLVIGLAIISGLGAIAMSLLNPDWYRHKRIEAGLPLEFNILDPNRDIRSMIVTKVVVIGILIWAAWYIATEAGYL